LAGWWGFAALSQADYTLKDPQGNEKGVELGAVLWTYLDKLPEAQQ
jgi:cobalt/nickel transport protein